jgi:hypothetical protein
MSGILTIAIDPGVNGGVAWHYNGKTTALRMPPTDFDTCQLLANLSKGQDLVELFIELPPLFAGRNIPGSAIGKMMLNYGICYGAAVALGFKIHPVRPPIWQKAHPVGTKGELSTTEWKNKLKARAAELYPDNHVTLATADALLILDAGLRRAIN